MASKKDVFAPPTEDEIKESMFAAPTEDELNELPATGSEKAQAALSGFGESATFGYLPEIQAAVEPATDKLFGFITGEEVDDQRSYDERLQDARGELVETQERAPGYALTGQLAGYAVPGSGIAKGTKALAKGTGNLAQMAKGAQGTGSLGQKIKGLSTVGAVEGAVYNPSRGEYEGDFSDRIMNAVTGAGFGAAIPVAGKAIKETVSGVAKGTKAGAKKIMSAIFGPEEIAINRYLKDPEAVQRAIEMDGVKSMVDDVVGNAKQNAVDAKISLKEAERKYRAAQEVLASEFKEHDKEIRNAFKAAEKELKVEVAKSYDQLNKVKPPSHLTDSIIESVDQLKRNVIRGSQEARDILTKEVKDPIDITGASDVLEEAMEDLIVGENVPKHSQAWFNAISDLRDDILQFEGVMAPYDIKKYMKQLDASIDIAETAGTFSSPDVVAKVRLRKYLDKTLKDISPGYADMMEAVAADARLLSDARKRLGTADKTMRTLNSIDRDVNIESRRILGELGERTGRDYRPDVAEYLGVKNKLKSLSDPDQKQAFMRDMDSWSSFEEAKLKLDELDALTEMDKKNRMRQSLAASEEAAELKKAQEKAQLTQETANMVRTFSEQSSEGKIKKLINVLNNGKKGEGITIRQEFEKLSQVGDQDFINIVEDLATASAFDKSYIRGSRGVNLFSILGMATGGGSAGFMLGGPVGAAAGAVLGAMNDLYGPKVAKSMLNGVLSIKGIPTVDKIMNLDLPPQAKKELILQFENYALTSLTGQAIKVDPEDIPSVREDIKRSEYIPESEKAKAIMELNRYGQINDVQTIIGKPPEEKTPEDMLLEKRIGQ